MKRARSSINECVSAIEKIRYDAAMRNVMTEGDSKDDREGEDEYRRIIEEEKDSYKKAFKRLKDLKAVIEQSKGLLKKSREKLQSDFDAWYKIMCDKAPTLSESIVESTEIDTVEFKEDASNEKKERSQGEAFRTETREKENNTLFPENVSKMAREESSNPSEATFRLPPGARLTGNKEADDDIIAFYKAKEALMARTRNRVSQIK